MIEVSKMIDNEQNQIYATLILRGKELNPQEVTDSLGLSPSMSFKIGDWRNETDRWKHNLWTLSSQDKIQSSNLANHLEWLLDQLEPVKPRLLDILNTNNIKAGISCFWILPTDNENLGLTAELLKKITDFGLYLEIDIYGP